MMRKTNKPAPTQFALFPASQPVPAVPASGGPRLLRLIAKLLRGAADRRTSERPVEGRSHE